MCMALSGIPLALPLQNLAHACVVRCSWGSILLVAICSTSMHLKAQEADSVQHTFHANQLNAALSASYTTSQNWQLTDVQNYAIAGSLFIQDDLQRINRREQHKLLADLSYLKLVDEVLTPMCSTRMNSSSYTM